MILVFLSASWLVGIYLGSQLRIDPTMPALAGLLPLAVALLWRKHSRVRLGALCLVALAAGLVRYQMALPPPDYGSIALHVGPRSVEIGGVVVAEPDTREQDIRLEVNTYHIGSGQDSFKVTGRIQVYVARHADVRYGDDLLLKGALQDPPEDEAFSYKGYLLRRGIYAVMYHPYVETIGRDQGNHLLAALYAFKQHLQRAIITYLPEPQAGLTQGIILGVKAVITDDLKEDLQRTGLTHIVVVSGYNLIVVATLLQRLAEKRLRRSLALLLSLAGVVTFTLMTGASPPVRRAAVMVIMTLMARTAGRESDALTSLLFTAALLVGIGPLTLWDVSFQLSFLATAGLVLLAPPLEGALSRLPLGTGSILGTTLAAQIMTLPVIALNFHRISLVSPLANVLVQPAIPPLMVLGAIVAFAGLTGHVLVRVVGWMTWLLGTYMVEVMQRLGSLPQAAVDAPTLPTDVQTPALIVYFAIIGLVFYTATHVHRGDLASFLQRVRAALRSSRSRLVVLVLAVLAIVVWALIILALRNSP